MVVSKEGTRCTCMIQKQPPPPNSKTNMTRRRSRSARAATARNAAAPAKLPVAQRKRPESSSPCQAAKRHSSSWRVEVDMKSKTSRDVPPVGRSRFAGALVAALLLLSCMPVRAESAGSIAGTISDATGTPLARVRVRLQNLIIESVSSSFFARPLH